MILTTNQLKQVQAYKDLVLKGESAASAASKVKVAASTIRGWIKNGENIAVPVQPSKKVKLLAVASAKKAKALIDQVTPITKASKKKSATKKAVVVVADLFPVTKKKSKKATPAPAVVEAPKKSKKKPAAKKAVAVVEEQPTKKVVDRAVAFQAIILPDTISIIFEGKPKQIDKRHANYSQIKQIIAENQKGGKIRASKLEEIRLLIDVKAGVAKASGGKITIDGQRVLVDGELIMGRLANRLMEAANSKNAKDIDRFVAFHKKVKAAANTGKLTERLFDFIEQKGLGIHDDGDVIAFKVVRPNFMDKHSGKMDNSVGKIVTMERSAVNSNDNETCSTGLHVCAPSYISHFGGGSDNLVACKVNPADFVSIPTDYNNAKARTCRYEVISVVGNVKEFLEKYKVKG